MLPSYLRTDGFFLFLDLAAVQFRDGALHRLDGTVLVNRLDVHGDDLGRIHVQKILQKLVADVGCRDAQKTGGAKMPPIWKVRLFLNAKAVGAMASFTESPLLQGLSSQSGTCWHRPC